MNLVSAAFLSLACTVAGQVTFLPGSAREVQVDWTKRNKGPDFTEVEVNMPLKMVVAEGLEEAVQLEVKEEGGCWSRVQRKSSKRGQKRRWKVAIVPCLRHSFRLVLENSTCGEYLELTQIVGGPQRSGLYPGFTPSTPSNLRMEANYTLSWDPAPCAERYRVMYKNQGIWGTPEEVNEPLHQLSTPPSDCMDVTLAVSAVLGQKTSKAVEFSFNTCSEEEHEDNATLDVSTFLFSNKEESVSCAATSQLPVCSEDLSLEPSLLIKNSTLHDKPSAGHPITGELMEDPKTEPTDNFDNLIIGGVLGALALCIVIVVILAIVIKKSTSSKRQYDVEDKFVNQN